MSKTADELGPCAGCETGVCELDRPRGPSFAEALCWVSLLAFGASGDSRYHHASALAELLTTMALLCGAGPDDDLAGKVRAAVIERASLELSYQQTRNDLVRAEGRIAELERRTGEQPWACVAGGVE